MIVRAVVEGQVNERLKEDGIDGSLRTGIDLDAFDSWEKTWPRPHSGDDGGWDWRRVVVRLRKRPARVEVAVWFGDELCGLVGGRLSERREVVRIDLLEGRPGPHPLKGWIALIAAAVGAVTAQAYSSQSVRFSTPLPGAIFIHEDLGFSYVAAFRKTASYCERRLP